MNGDVQLKGMKVLVVEDHDVLAELLAEEISDAGMESRWVSTAEKAVSLLTRWAPDLVVSDLRLPGISGLDLLQKAKSASVPPAFLIVTAFGTVSQAVEALKVGADDFLTKPLDLRHFMHRVTRLLEIRSLRKEVKDFRRTLFDDTFHGMYGKSGPMRNLFSQIKQIAPASGPVLVSGESGVGKELVAKAIHACSYRSDGPFLAVNCAGIPETLMESEFFGHVAGSFTGSRGSRQGLFQEAGGGTLLLDEIAEMPMALQSKLLRILQDGSVRPVGSNQEQKVDVRIIAATHQDLETAVKDGRIRADLFYRLETFSLHIPPLRERDEDIELLAHRFLVHFNKRMGKSIEGFSESALEMIMSYPFPGNVRELQNAVERAVTFCGGSKIRPEQLPARIRGGSTTLTADSASTLTDIFNSSKTPSLAEVERHYVKHVLDQVGGNKKKAADLLGITRKTLYRRLA